MSIPSLAQAERLAALRTEINAIAPQTRQVAGRLGFGVPEVDRRLAGQGLAVDGLHEVAAGTTHLGDDAAASLFTAGLASRLSPSGTVLWILSRTDLFAPGLAQAGLGPERLLQVDARSDEDALAVMEDGLRHGGLAAVVCEVSSKADLTATRRLQLAAEEGGTMALLLRRWKRMKSDPLAANSAAMTRWRIRCAPSTPLPVAGVGRPRWEVELVRQRGGDPCHWLLEGCDASGRLALPAEPRHGSVAPAPARRRARQAA
jgi:protein ImuA